MRKKPENSTWTDEQWEAIVTEGKNTIVSAGAGSGKTAVLTTRIIDKLEQGVSIDELIVLTFTEAAAFEMKERVRKALQKKQNENPWLAENLKKIDTANITTFDSYSLSLLKKYHYLLNIDANIKICDDILIQKLKIETMEEVFQKFYEKKDPSFLQYLDTFTLKDDKDIKSSLLYLSDKLDVLYDKIEYLQTYEKTYLSPKFLEDMVNEYEHLFEEKKEQILKLFHQMKESIYDPILSTWMEEIASIEKIKDCHTYQDYFELFDKFTLKRFPTSKKIDEEAKEKAKKQYERLKEELSSLKESLRYHDMEEFKEEIKQMEENNKVLISILLEYETLLEKQKAKKNFYTFADVTRKSIYLLKHYPSIAEEIKRNTKEIMIDECQDTNDIGDYFISLISNHNVYMVGDIKQSIYGFRNANPKIFGDKYEQFKKGIDGIKIDLNKNFRSRKEVLEDINFLFEKLMDKEIGGADYPSGHQMVFGNQDYETKGKTNTNHHMEILNYSFEKNGYRKEEMEAFIIANDIKKRLEENEMVFDKKGFLRPMEYKDICILMDRKTNFDLYKKIFTYFQLPLTIHKDEEFVNSDEVYAFRSILRLLYSYQGTLPKETVKHSFLSLGRSFLFSYTDDQLFSIVTKEEFPKNIEELPELYEKLKRLKEKTKYYSLFQLTKEIFECFSFYTNINRIGNVAFLNKKLDYLLSLSDTMDSLGYTLKDYLDYFDFLLEKGIDVKFSFQEEASNSINLMTVHKSKGLEYPVCYFPGLYKAFSKEDLKSKYLYSKHYGILSPIFKEGIYYPVLKDFFAFEHTKEDISEKLRLFYVATTRAREKMIFVANLGDNKKEYQIENDMVIEKDRLTFSSFYDMLASISKYLGYYQRDISLDSLNLTKAYNQEKKISFDKIEEKPYQIKKIHEEREKVEEVHFSKTPVMVTKQEKEAMRFGEKMHEYLEFLSFEQIEEEFKKYEVPSFFQEKIRHFLAIFYLPKKPLQVYKEYEFFIETKEEEKHGIIDLLFEYEEEFVLIDYKLKEIKKPEYKEQIKGYKEYLQTKTKKPVKAYLYSILEEKYLEC